MLGFKLICLWILIQQSFVVFAKDNITVNFIKSYIENEQKPTILITCNLCWPKSKILKLFKTLSSLGVRSSSSSKEESCYQDHVLLFFVDLNCPQSMESFHDPKYLRSPYRWLVLQDHANKDERQIKSLWDIPLLADSDFVLAERNGDIIALTELYKPSSHGPTYSNQKGYFKVNGSTVIDTRVEKELFRRRKDVMGHSLTMSNVIQDSNSTQYHLPSEDRLELQYDSIAKASWMHVRIAFEMLNATPQYIFSHRWGYKNNGKWSGMINDLETGRADLGTECIPRTERLSVVVFTDSIFKYKVKFIYRQPPLSYVTNIFTLPFSLNVWVAIMFCIIISSVTICLATKWEKLQIGTDQTQLDGSFEDAMLLTVSALSQQGCSKEPKKVAGRIMLLVVFTALMALYAAYSANIVVLLQASSTAIKTLEQLVNSKITLAALDVDYNYFVLKEQKDSLRRAVHRKIEPEKGKAQFYDLNEGVERIRQGLFAFHSITEPVYRKIEETFLETEKCDLMEVDFMNVVYPFVPVYKNSPYLELLKVAFKRLSESGITLAIEKRFLVPKPRCTDKKSAFSSVSLLNLLPVLLFMLYGIGISLLILLAEILIHKISIRRTIVRL